MDQGYDKDGYKGAMLLAAETLAAIAFETYISPYFIALVYAFAGEKEQTLNWLYEGYEIKEPSMPYLAGDGAINKLLANESRLNDLLQKMNLYVEE